MARTAAKVEKKPCVSCSMLVPDQQFGSRYHSANCALARSWQAQEEKIKAAIRAYGEAMFECGEWDSGESEEAYAMLDAKVRRAYDKLQRLIGIGN